MADAYLRWKYSVDSPATTGNIPASPPPPKSFTTGDPQNTAGKVLDPSASSFPQHSFAKGNSHVTSDETQDPPPSPRPSPTTSGPITTVPPAQINDSHSSLAPTTAHGIIRTRSPGSSTPGDVEIPVIDIYTLSTSTKVFSTGNQTTASTLASLGFIGNAPFHPSVAVSVKTLELYHTLRR
jgi:hypothetical protein